MMNMSKNQLMMLGIGIGALILVYFLFFRKKDTKKESSYGPEFGAYQSYGYESSMAASDPLCNRRQTNKPCWDWVIHKGPVHVPA